MYSNGILKYHKTYKCEAPGLVTGRSGSIGSFTYISDGKYWPHNTSLWVTDFKNNYPPFIYYLYQTINISQYASGSSVPTLNRNDVHRHITYLPTFIEQVKIAKLLVKIDERIDTQKKIIEKYESLIRGLCQQLFCFDEYSTCYLGNICSITTGKLDANAMVMDGKYPFFTCAEEVFNIDNYAFDTEALLISGNGANLGYIRQTHRQPLSPFSRHRENRRDHRSADAFSRRRLRDR